MDTNARNELYSIKRELTSIITELESISSGVRRDFCGIGEDQCAESINKVLEQYYFVRRKLNNLDTHTVVESFAASNGGGGGR